MITGQWLRHIGLEQIKVNQRHGPVARDLAYDLLVEHMERHVEVDGILRLIAKGGTS